MNPQRKAARISPESRPIAFTAVGVATLIYAGAFTTSFFGQAALAAHMAIPSALQYVVPVVVDLALVLFTLATLLRKTRGESTLWTNLATAAWTTVSIAANVLHVLVPAGAAESWNFGIYTGAALSALMPLGALGASLVLENLLIEPPAAVHPAASAVVAVPVAKEPAVEAPDAPSEPAPAVEAPAARPTVLTAAERPAAALASVPALSVRPTPARPQAARPVAASKVTSDPRVIAQVLAHKAEGKSIPAIADLVGKSESTVKRYIKDAKAAAEQDSKNQAA
ncbi:DUF2637 domain-containing protein [Pseudarthrobacter phenanthrenivorans]|uniref:DUF2637 domain-containing protein n=1 Tax=Pseudarthrobacter phenanthrenivorans TaxID=361575 RepID=A0A0B4EPR7_PSEPS|nr:DUF2637 domain-containing protein [Pseudarthrobacter phenanthrenivorans]KIC68698.1 hypothetical protein RM50_04355 [Pseudarthrobacter phenanthrenivorans]